MSPEETYRRIQAELRLGIPTVLPLKPDKKEKQA